MRHIPATTPETGSGFCSSPSAKACPFSCRAKRVFPSGETLILPVSRDSRYNTLHFASKAVCQREAPLGTPVLSGSRYSLHKSAAIPHPSKTQAGGIGQPVPGADLCRLLAYMGAYCIAHINRSNLLLPYAPCFWRCRSAWPPRGRWHCFPRSTSPVRTLAPLCSFASCTTPLPAVYLYVRKVRPMKIPQAEENSARGITFCKKASQSLLPQEQINGIIFSGDMCVGENSARLANVRTQ